MISTSETYGWEAVTRSLKALRATTSPNRTHPADIAQSQLPNSKLTQDVLFYAKRELSLPTFNHSMRVYHYGIGIHFLSQHFSNWKISAETLLLTALLHDIGTTNRNIRGTQLSFEFHGGYIALDLLKNFGADVSQAEAVCETIIRHQDLGDSGMVTTLTAIIHFATVLDNAGLFPELIHPDTIQNVVSKYPRLGWTGCFADVVRLECQLKPWANTSRIEGFAEMVEANQLMAPFDR